MDPIQGSEAIQQFKKLLEENNREGQAADLSALMWYMDGMTRQYEAVLRELQNVRQQLDQEREPPVQYVAQRAAATLEHKAHQIKGTLNSLWERIAGCAAAAVKNFKEIGVSALDKAIAAMGVKNVLESLHDHLNNSIADTKRSIEKVENMGYALRSVGGHLKNAGRAMAGKETLAVDGGQEGRFQSAVLAPMRATQKLLCGMNNATLAAIGGMEHLEQTAEAAREARAERQAEKKPSVRQTLAEKKAEAAAQSIPTPEKEHKPQEAAL